MKYFLLFFFFLGACAFNSSLQKISLRAGENIVPLRVEIADDTQERAVGLQDRASLKRNHGMLFVFEEEKPLTFWMKDTLIPLDVLYFDAEGNFVSMNTMEPCTEDPCDTYPSTRPAKYALELNAGFYDEKLQPLLQDSGEELQLLLSLEE